jgi:hypothetical protein
MEKTDLSDVREVVVDYAAMPPDDQWNFRRGMHASGNLTCSDSFLHQHLMELDLIRIAGFRTFMLQTFSLPFTWGYCFGSEMTVSEKRALKTQEKQNV